MLVLTLAQNSQGQAQLNASFTQGDVIGWSFAAKIAGVPINLTGATVKMTIGFSTPLLLSTDNGAIIMTDAANGQFIANMSSMETAAFVPGTYPYDVWIEYQKSPPVETQYITGNVTVNQSITGVP